MRTRPTPGPWHYETNSQGNVTIFATRNGDDDKHIIGVSQFGPLEQREADAQLMSSAPDLFEALEGAVKALKLAKEVTGLDQPAYVIAGERALAKARGGQVPA